MIAVAGLIAATSVSKVLAEGWLKKETGGKAGGKPSGAMLKQVGNLGSTVEDTRYFVLTPLYLRYYEVQEDCENDKKPKGTVQMAGCTLEQRNKPGKAFKPKFKIVIPGADGGGRRMLSLIAGGKEDMDFWIANLEAAIMLADQKAEQDKTGNYLGNESAENLALLTHEGNLEKKGKALVAGKAVFQTRWFRLRDGVIYYYSAPSDTVPINWIQLDSHTTVTVDEDDVLKFRIITGHGKKFVLKSIIDDNGKSREEWVKAIFGVVKVYCNATGEKPTADPIKQIDESHRYRQEIEDIENGISDGGPKKIWKDPANWKPWMQFVGAEYFFGLIGLWLVIGCLYNFEIEGALIVVVLTAAGVCFYRRKHAKGKKKWQKHRDPAKYKSKHGGLKGLKGRAGGKDDSVRDEGLLGGGGMAGMGGSAAQMGAMGMAKGMGAAAKFANGAD